MLMHVKFPEINHINVYTPTQKVIFTTYSDLTRAENTRADLLAVAKCQ